MQESRKKTFGIVGLLIVLLSFVFNIFSTQKVSASSTSIVQNYVELTSIERIDNTIKFKTKEKYNVDSITYEINYQENSQMYGDLINNAKVNQIDDFTYSFEVTDDILGVKIWKVKYFVSSGYFKNKMTIGNNSIGNLEAIYKKNYIEVTTDKLEERDCVVCFASNLNDFQGILNDNSKIYVFYFNLDTKIDKIVDLSLEYSIKNISKEAFKKEKVTIKSYEVKLYEDQLVFDFQKSDKELELWLNENSNPTADEISEKSNEIIQKNYKRNVLGANDNGNGYDWYVQPALDLMLKTDSSSSFLGHEYAYEREYLQETAIIKMSYYAQGQYFSDIPVKDEDTGEAFYNKDKDTLDQILDFFNNVIEWCNENKTKVLIGIAVVVISLIIIFFKKIIRLFKKIVYGIYEIMCAIFSILKWTVFLPFTLIIIINRKIREKKKLKVIPVEPSKKMKKGKKTAKKNNITAAKSKT